MRERALRIEIYIAILKYGTNLRSCYYLVTMIN